MTGSRRSSRKLGHASLPVAFDELEAEEDNRRASGIIKLVRQAASGGVLLRGGADHKGTEFLARSCFLFSSILMPLLLPQDRSRMAVLELDRLGGAKPPQLEPDRLAEFGAGLRRRMVDGWSRYGAALESYRLVLATKGHNGRSADQFGTLLACADILLYDHDPSGDDLEQWAERLKLERPAGDSTPDEESDHEQCLSHLLTSITDQFRGGKKEPLGMWFEQAAGLVTGDQQEARDVLATYGLRLVSQDDAEWLAVAISHQGLAGLFAHTHWAARSGASGVWSQSLRRVPGARNSAHSIRFHGWQGRAVPC